MAGKKQKSERTLSLNNDSRSWGHIRTHTRVAASVCVHVCTDECLLLCACVVRLLCV